MDWTQKIPGCFGSDDLNFAGHPCDAERAFDLLKECRDQNVGLQELENAVRQFLASKTANKQHIADQIKRIREHCEPWLLS